MALKRIDLSKLDVEHVAQQAEEHVKKPRKNLIIELDPDIHLRLKKASVELKKPMRKIIGELVEAWLDHYEKGER